MKPVRETLVAATEVGVKYLTLYAFSTENWNRPKAEVEALMDLLVSTLVGEVTALNENGVRLNATGDIEGLPTHCRGTLREAIERTAPQRSHHPHVGPQLQLPPRGPAHGKIRGRGFA